LPAVFGGDLFGQSGSVASPLYPRQYPNDATYTWTVTVDLGSRVMASFQTLNMEGQWRGNCVYDYVKVGLTFHILLHNTQLYSPIVAAKLE